MLAPAEMAFLWAAGGTAVAAILAACYLHRPLRRMLSVHVESVEHASFWSAFAHLIIFLLPLFFVGLGRTFLNTRESEFFILVQYLLWAMGGLVTALLVVAMVVVSLPRRRAPDPQPSPGSVRRLPPSSRPSLN